MTAGISLLLFMLGGASARALPLVCAFPSPTAPEIDELSRPLAGIREKLRDLREDRRERRLTEECEEREGYLKERIAAGTSVGETLRSVITTDTKVVLLGENHFSHAGDLGYPGLLEEIRTVRPAMDCLFLEYAADLQPAFDDYLARRIGFRDFVGRHYSFASNELKSTLGYARSQGIKVFAVDEDMSLMSGDRDEIHRQRNRTMTSRIKDHLESGDCRFGVTINGMGHLERRGALNPSMTELLRRSRVPAAGLQLISPQYEVREHRDSKFSSYTWPECSWNPDEYDRAFGFTTPGPSPRLRRPLTGDRVDHPRWQNFDGTLVLPRLTPPSGALDLSED